MRPRTTTTNTTIIIFMLIFLKMTIISVWHNVNSRIWNNKLKRSLNINMWVPSACRGDIRRQRTNTTNSSKCLNSKCVLALFWHAHFLYTYFSSSYIIINGFAVCNVVFEPNSFVHCKFNEIHISTCVCFFILKCYALIGITTHVRTNLLKIYHLANNNISETYRR